MAQDPPLAAEALFTQLDVSPARDPQGTSPQDESLRLLRELVAGQDRQNELLEELISTIGAAQRQRAAELNHWKQANPRLARDCRKAAETLGRIQTEYLRRVTEEVCENGEPLLDGDFLLNEFVDRFGPRLIHLHGVLQVLSQLSWQGNSDQNA
jgi:predicted DsbA family dithiol-disulfide isomerase